MRLAVLVGVLAACRPAVDPPAASKPVADEALAAAPRDPKRAADFEELWAFVDATYPFFPDKRTDWARVRTQLGPAAAADQTDLEFMHRIEETLDQLYDPHCMLGTNADDSWRPVPGDVWVEPVGDAALVMAVTPDSPEDRAGIRIGHTVTKVRGQSIADAIAMRYPKSLDPGVREAQAWALLSAVAGRHSDGLTLTVREANGTEREITVEGIPPEATAAVSSRALEGPVGYIAISTFASGAGVVEAFDAALEPFKGRDALIIDVRNNAGGDTLVAKPIMGRFIDERRQYAQMAKRDGEGLGEKWAEFVEPRGPWTYEGLVIVLVDRMSRSMAEGFAMGMQGMRRATVVGTRMAGLGAATARRTLTHSQLPVQISAEPVYHLDGSPRWRMAPDVEVDPVAGARAGVSDPILAAGQAEVGSQLQCSQCSGNGTCTTGCCRERGWYDCDVRGTTKRCIRYTPCAARCCTR